mmetsp:Transcript_107841/g.300678  ORF Transcript_107841/g.300678 Transcript_107841/m.300678 type:complete len:107 (+) Transcript_107841:65-385(+)
MRAWTWVAAVALFSTIRAVDLVQAGHELEEEDGSTQRGAQNETPRHHSKLPSYFHILLSMVGVLASVAAIRGQFDDIFDKLIPPAQRGKVKPGQKGKKSSQTKKSC